MIPPNQDGKRPFQFERDTFAYAHELVWQYCFDPVTGEISTFRTDPPPTYYHRCFLMVRSARQFFFHARFEPGIPPLDAVATRGLVRQILRHSPRYRSPDSERVVVPGYDSLRSFSQAREEILKAECGAAWESYALLSHWRMVFPVWAGHQKRVAERLKKALLEGAVPIVHLFRFPHVTINHGIALFGLLESSQELRFSAYDPNIPGHPVELRFDLASGRFSFPRTHYFPGGAVSAIEIYRPGVLGFFWGL